MGEPAKVGDAGGKGGVTVKGRAEFREHVVIGERAGAYRGEMMRERDGLVVFYMTRADESRGVKSERRGVLVPWSNVAFVEFES